MLWPQSPRLFHRLGGHFFEQRKLTESESMYESAVAEMEKKTVLAEQ